MSEFDSKVVVVTGAAGALGRAVVEHFAGLGARIAQLDVIKLHNAHFSATVDLTDLEACRSAVIAIDKELGPIDVVANIAGGFDMGPAVHETPAETWDFLMGLNAHSVLNMARAAVPGMLARGRGKIINIGAGAGQRGVAKMGAYSASKSVVIRLTEAMADELKGAGINVNCILPSVIDTERNRADMPKADFEKWVKPGDMAKVIAFLASSDADPIHGAVLPVVGLS
jgi:NAD(P)-dependent dehydrogenase (short-subunit alcohol dehydrogenase family)